MTTQGQPDLSGWWRARVYRTRLSPRLPADGVPWNWPALCPVRPSHGTAQRRLHHGWCRVPVFPAHLCSQYRTAENPSPLGIYNRRTRRHLHDDDRGFHDPDQDADGEYDPRSARGFLLRHAGERVGRVDLALDPGLDRTPRPARNKVFLRRRPLPCLGPLGGVASALRGVGGFLSPPSLP